MISTAARHELRLMANAQPLLPAVLLAGRLAKPMRRLPKLGWFVADPLIARQIYNDSTHFSIVAEGAAGHFWAQVIGDWVTEIAEGPGHTDLRRKVHDLFTPSYTDDLVARTIGPKLDEAAAQLAAGQPVDIAALARIVVGRSVADLVGMQPSDVAATFGSASDDPDAPFEELFDHVEQFANVAIGSMATTTFTPETLSKAKGLAEKLTSVIPAAYGRAASDTTLGRCRDLGVNVQHATGLALLMAVAGTDTLASSMTRMTALLHDTGEQHILLRNPDLTPGTVRETLRVTSPAYLVGRSVVKNVEVHGNQLRAGEHVKILTWTINNAPGGFALERGYLPELRQLWFAGGRHLCLGAQLVHSELTALLGALTASGKPWTITERKYRRRVFIPTYEKLMIQL